MKKKIFTLMITTMLVMSTALVGCNDTDTNDVKEKETSVVDTEGTESISEAVTESTEVVETITENVTEVTETAAETTGTESDVVTNDNKPKEESKSGETTSKTTTSNTTSNSGESNNKPAEHVHTWVDITEDVVVTDSPATTKQELVKEAWDETVVDVPESSHDYSVFNYDGYIATTGEDYEAHCKELMFAKLPCNSHTETIVTPAVTHTVRHEAEYQTVEVPAVTHVETRVVGQKCSTCGATK